MEITSRPTARTGVATTQTASSGSCATHDSPTAYAIIEHLSDDTHGDSILLAVVVTFR
jgi:hypothetical protein